VTLNRPEVHSSIDATKQVALREVWTELRYADSARVAIVTRCRALWAGLEEVRGRRLTWHGHPELLADGVEAGRQDVVDDGGAGCAGWADPSVDDGLVDGHRVPLTRRETSGLWGGRRRAR
jgi:hypothetical protein